MLLIIAILAGALYALVRPWPVSLAGGDLSADVSSLQAAAPRPGGAGDWLRRIDGLPRQVLILVVAAALAYLLMTEALAAWFGLATRIGTAIGLGAGWVTLLIAAILGGIGYRFAAQRTARRNGASAMPEFDKAAMPPAAPVSPSVSPPVAPSVLPDAVPAAVASAKPAQPAEAVRLMTATVERPARRTGSVLGVLVIAALSFGAVFTQFHPQWPALKERIGAALRGATGDEAAGPVAAPSASASIEAAASPSAPAAEAIAVDGLLNDLLDGIRTARDARLAITAQLRPQLAAAERDRRTVDAERLRAAIAKREQKVVEARQKARETLALIAQAEAADPAALYRAKQTIVADDDAADYLEVIARVEYPDDQPDAFVTAAMAAWERAVAPPAVSGTQSLPPVSAVQPRTGSPVRQADRDGSSATQRRSSFSEPRYSRQPGSARDRQRSREREYHPGVAPLPADEYQ